MLYLIKIGYTLLFPPGIIILLLISISLWLLQKKEALGFMLVGIAAALLYFSSIPYVGSLFLHTVEARYSPPEKVSGDVIVMLGGGAILEVTDPLTGGTGYLGSHTAARLLTTAELYRQTKLPVIVSGGQVFSDSGNEAQIAKRHLLALGVPEDDILLEDQSLNTAENAANTASILTQHHWEHPVLVTSAFHMARAVKQFKEHKVDVLPFPTDYQSNSTMQSYVSKFIPSSDGLMTTAMTLKEYLGFLVP